MNIILGSDNADALRDRYVVLELDTFRYSHDQAPVTAYCVIDHVPIMDMPMISRHRDMHEELLEDYKTQHWQGCRVLIDQLQGCWNGELDEFYGIMTQRIDRLAESGTDPDWDGIITK